MRFAAILLGILCDLLPKNALFLGIFLLNEDGESGKASKKPPAKEPPSPG